MDYNHVVIVGRLTRDPEIKTIPSGTSVATLSIATSRQYKGQDGEKKKQTEFHSVVVWGKMAETVATYMKKGSQILIEGYLQTRSWEGQDGQKKYKTEIVAQNFQFGAKSKNDSHQQEAPSYDEAAADLASEETNAEGIPF